MSPIQKVKPVSPVARASRGRVLAAAAKVFAAKPYRDAKISDIAHEAGVSVGLVYLALPSKEALYEAAVNDGLLADGQPFADGVGIRLWVGKATNAPVDSTYRILYAEMEATITKHGEGLVGACRYMMHFASEMSERLGVSSESIRAFADDQIKASNTPALTEI